MPDPCEPIQKRTNQAQDTKRALQEDLKDAAPSQKPGIIKLIKQLDAEIEEQKKLLQSCRKDNPAPLRPDIGLELRTCLDSTDRQIVERELNDRFAEQRAVSHASCLQGSERIGVWAPSVGTEEGRRAGLEFVDLLRTVGETFGMSLSRNLITRRVRVANEQMPRAFDGDGKPNPSGPFFISSVASRLQPPATVITTLDGFRRLPSVLPEIDFTVTINDTFRIAGADDDDPLGTLTVDSSADIETDLPGPDVILQAALGGVIGVLLAAFQVALGTADGAIPRDVGGLDESGIGRALLPFFPVDVAVNGQGELRFVYSRIQVFPGFILAGGTLLRA